MVYRRAKTIGGFLGDMGYSCNILVTGRVYVTFIIGRDLLITTKMIGS